MPPRHLMLTDYRIRQRDYLLEIVRALTQQLDLETVLRRILAAAVDMLGARSALVILRDQLPTHLSDEGQLRVRAYYQLKPQVLQAINSALADTCEGKTPDELVPELLQRLLKTIEAGGQPEPSALGLPLIVAEQFIGALVVFRQTAAPFGPDERQILEAFADQAAIAVQNARLYEHALSEQRRLDATLDGSADGIMILNPDQSVQRWNRALALLTGVDAANALGRQHDALVRWTSRRPGPDLKDAVANGWPLSQQSVLYVEGDLLRADGSSVAVGVTYAPIFDDRGALVNLVANLRDITQFREAERAKSTFISVVSHELKTPVSLIKGYASTLQRPDAPLDKALVQEGLQVIEEEADRLTALIENLLDASRLQAGGIVLARDDVYLPALAAELASRFALQTTRHTITVDFPDNFPMVTGDEERLRQVLTNLISNALKYAPGGDIVISGRVQARMVVVQVSDEGPGMPKHELERIFERFHRARTDATDRAQGAGLGLYLARTIVNAHGGHIWAESTLGQGTTFFFTLPRPAARLNSPAPGDVTIG